MENTDHYRIIEAIELANQTHKGRYREGTKKMPEIVHPARVAFLSGVLTGNNPSAICAGWLHDTVEDCELPYDRIRSHCGADVEKYVRALTRLPGMPEIFYFKQIKDAGEIPQLVKLADVFDNGRDTITAGLEPKILEEFSEYYLTAYRDLYIPLADKLRPEMAKMLRKNVFDMFQLTPSLAKKYLHLLE